MTEQPGHRPKPQYGEYADDAPSAEAGELSEQAAETGDGSGASEALAIQVPASAPSPQFDSGSASLRPSFEPIPGVPHNLGVAGGSSSTLAQAPPATGEHQAVSGASTEPKHGEPYRSHGQPTVGQSAVQPMTPPAAAQGSSQQTPGAPRVASRTADRIITIILLALGGYGALQSAYSLMTLGANLSDLAVNVFQIDGFVLPQAVNTIGTVGAITMLTLYALILIFSIRRMRARKITFWAPLAAGLLSVILMLAFYSIALSQSPELIQAGTDPDAFQRMLDYAAAQGA